MRRQAGRRRVRPDRRWGPVRPSVDDDDDDDQGQRVGGGRAGRLACAAEGGREGRRGGRWWSLSLSVRE